MFLLSANPGCQTNPSKTFTWNIYFGGGGEVEILILLCFEQKKKQNKTVDSLLYN